MHNVRASLVFPCACMSGHCGTNLHYSEDTTLLSTLHWLKHYWLHYIEIEWPKLQLALKMSLIFILSGYANEVGEAFRAQVHVNVVRASYGVASAYVVADAISKGKEAALVWTIIIQYIKVWAFCLLANLAWFFVVCRFVKKNLSGMHSVLTVWIQIRHGFFWGLIWVQTYCLQRL